MKKIFKNDYNYLPIIIILICSLGIYFIYYYKQKEYYENFIKNHINTDSIVNNNFNNTDTLNQFNNIEQFSNKTFEENKIIIENALNNVVFTRYLANGDWTTNQSNYKNNIVTNLIKININKELKGTIDFSSIKPGDIYNINNVSNMVITAVNSKNKNKSIILDFKNIFLEFIKDNKLIEGFIGYNENENDIDNENIEYFSVDNNLINNEIDDFKNKNKKKEKNKNKELTYLFIKEYLKDKVDLKTIEYYFNNIKNNNIKFKNIVRCKISFYTNNILNLEYFSYKIFDKMNTGGFLSRLILSQQYYDIDLNMKHNLYLYNKYLKKYKYPSNMLITNYSSTYNNKTEPNFTNNLLKKYSNQLYILYQREFLTIDNQILRTPISQPFIINIINNKGLYFNNIEIKSINNNEKKINNIEKNFKIKNTLVYFYKLIQQENKYSFKDNKNELKSQFNLQNDANTMFNNNNISFPNLFNTINTNNSTYNLTLIKSYKTNNDNDVIKISYLDIKNII